MPWRRGWHPWGWDNRCGNTLGSCHYHHLRINLKFRSVWLDVLSKTDKRSWRETLPLHGLRVMLELHIRPLHKLLHLFCFILAEVKVWNTLEVGTRGGVHTGGTQNFLVGFGHIPRVSLEWEFELLRDFATECSLVESNALPCQKPWCRRKCRRWRCTALTQEVSKRCWHKWRPETWDTVDWCARRSPANINRRVNCQSCHWLYVH